MIEIFTKNNCQPCRMTKAWFRDKGINFKETNVDDNLDALAFLIENDLRTLPIVMVNSEVKSLGFMPNRWEDLK